MATRTSKKSTTIKTSMSGIETPKSTKGDMPSTPSTSKSTKSSRMSPLSPTRISRLQEKTDLQNLNDRLAAYIDRVRQLELENNRLNVQVETIQESVKKEVVSMKSIYEQELSDARKLIDDTAQEKASLQIEAGKLRTENEDLRLKFSRKERDLLVSEKSLTLSQSQGSHLQGKVTALENEKKKIVIELRDLKDEVAKLTRQLAEAKKQLEGETLARVDLENRCQSLKEELQFKQQLYETEITESRSRKQVEISQIDGRLQEEYESKMQEGLQDLRDQYEEQLRINRTEIENLYETKVEDLNRRLSRGVSESDDMSNMLKESRIRISDLSSKTSQLEHSNAILQQRVSNLENQLDVERDAHRNEILNLKDELELLREQMSGQLLEYQDLMDIKIALDMEISAYRKLLEAEESRLNLTPSIPADTPSRRVGKHGLKRKRVEEDNEKSSFQSSSRSSGDLQIMEECPEGKFIKIQNNSTKDILIGGSQLVRKAGDEEIMYKFHLKLKMPASSTITVWSANSNQTHDAPHNLVMKNQNWPITDFMKTLLYDADGEEIAYFESKRQHESYSSTSHKYGSYPIRSDMSRLYMGCVIC